MKRVRFGVRVPIFPNAGVFVFYLEDGKFKEFERGVALASAYLPAEFRRRLVFEYQEGKA